MIRRFKFEDEVHHSLACVPMAVRRKLDCVGVKVSLEQWQALAQYERTGFICTPMALIVFYHLCYLKYIH